MNMRSAINPVARVEPHRQPDIAVARERHICKVRHRGRRGASVFLFQHEFRNYQRDLLSLVRASGTRLHAFCLLPNEVQLLLGNVSRAGLRRLLTQLAARHVYRQCGGNELPQFVFESALKLSLPSDDDAVLAAGSEIDLLPLRRALVARPEQYRWSSYSERAGVSVSTSAEGGRAPLFPGINRGVSEVNMTQPESAYLDLAAGPALRARAYRRLVDSRISSLQQRLLDRAADARLLAFEVP